MSYAMAPCSTIYRFTWRFNLFSGFLQNSFYTSRHDTYLTPKRLFLHHISLHTGREPILLFGQLLTCVRRSEKLGFCWRYQDRGAFFCFDGEGEEEEE